MSPFDNLPAELYDEICENLVYEPWDVRNNCSRRPTRDDVHAFDHLINIRRRPMDHGIIFWPRPGSPQLRLVNRAFNRAMLRVYFKYEGVAILASEEKALERAEEHLLRSGNVEREGKGGWEWDIAKAVHKLTVELCPGEYGEGSIFEVDHGLERPWQREQRRNEKLDAGAERLARFFDEGTLRRAVWRMPKLAALIVNLNEEWREDETTYIDSDDEDGDGLPVGGLQLRLDLLRSVREGIAELFKPFPQPASNLLAAGTLPPPRHLPSLTYLRLALPCAYDFAHLASCMPDAVALRLRHLYLEVVDGTGQGGDLYYTRSWDGDSDSEGDELYPFSNLQRKYPNTAYMRDMCGLVNRCRKLESLGLVGTQCIDLSGLDWRPADGSGGLKNVYLTRVIGTADALASLLSPGSDSDSQDGNLDSNIEAFQLESVQLVDGTWASVFAPLVPARKLVYIHVDNVVYNKFGRTAHLAEHNNRPWENYTVMWSENEEDEERLRDVITAVWKRGGRVDQDMAEMLRMEK